METLVGTVPSLSPMAAGVLVASVWQGLLLTAGVAVALHGLRGIPAAARTWIWTVVLAIVVLLPWVEIVVPHEVVAGRAGLHVPGAWSVGLLAVWAGFAAVRATGLVANAVRLRGVARRATPVVVGPDLAVLLEGPRRAVLCVSAEVNRPSVAGFFRARVLLPLGLLETLSAGELEHVVLHEMEHLRRRDDWLNLLQQVSLVLLPLNPAVMWLDRRLCRERELACDDRVLAATRANKAYAACLVKLAEDSLLRKGVALALSALGTRARESELVARVRRILAGPEQGCSAGRVRLTVGTVAAGLLVGVGLLARGPEVVSFDGASQGMAQTASAGPVALEAPPSGGRMVAASAVMHPGMARPMLANAILQRPLRMARPVGAIAAGRPRLRMRAGTARTTVRAAKPWAAVATRASVENVSRPRTVPAVAFETMTAGRVVVTKFEVSQPLYAAVPVRGGWLILQL